MSEKLNRHCVNCLRLEQDHLNLGNFLACPTGQPDRFYLGVEFVPATNLEYLERKVDKTLR